MMQTSGPAADPVRARLLKAALDSFLCDDYHKVTTRLIAERAGTNVAMIRYYFGNKEGLYEEMIRDTMAPLLDVLDGQMLQSAGGFKDFLLLKDIFEEQMQRPVDAAFLEQLAAFNGRLFAAGLAPANAE